MNERRKEKFEADTQEWLRWRKMMAENPNPALKNWRAWGSWFSWGSPVGLAIFLNTTLLSIGLFILMVR
jgi:hypothetical protein